MKSSVFKLFLLITQTSHSTPIIVDTVAAPATVNTPVTPSMTPSPAPAPVSTPAQATVPPVASITVPVVSTPK